MANALGHLKVGDGDSSASERMGWVASGVRGLVEDLLSGGGEGKGRQSGCASNR